MQENSNQRISPQSSQCFPARDAPLAAYRPCSLDLDALHKTNSKSTQPQAATLNQEQCWVWHESAAARMNRLGEPQHKRPTEQHPLSLQIRKAVSKLKPTAWREQTGYMTIGLSMSQYSVHRYFLKQHRPASSCIHSLSMKTSKDLENLGKGLSPSCGFWGHLLQEVTLPLWPGVQVFKLPSYSQASCNPANRIKHQWVLTLLKLNWQFSFQHQEFRSRNASDSIIQLCFPSVFKVSQYCTNHTAASLPKICKYHWQKWFTSSKCVTTG